MAVRARPGYCWHGLGNARGLRANWLNPGLAGATSRKQQDDARKAIRGRGN
jgi:hypothetical protein